MLKEEIDQIKKSTFSDKYDYYGALIGLR